MVAIQGIEYADHRMHLLQMHHVFQESLFLWTLQVALFPDCDRP